MIARDFVRPAHASSALQIRRMSASGRPVAAATSRTRGGRNRSFPPSSGATISQAAMSSATSRVRPSSAARMAFVEAAQPKRSMRIPAAVVFRTASTGGRLRRCMAVHRIRAPMLRPETTAPAAPARKRDTGWLLRSSQESPQGQ